MSKEDLIPLNKRTKEEQKKICTAGGKKSGEVRREKKLMSQIYAEFLEKEHDIIGKDGIKKKLTGNKLLSSVMSKILSRGDSASVSLMKEIRESTEGNNINITNDAAPVVINVVGVDPERPDPEKTTSDN